MRRMATFGLPPYQIFTWEEIHDASNNFDSSNLVGEDSQGQVKAFNLEPHELFFPEI